MVGPSKDESGRIARESPQKMVESGSYVLDESGSAYKELPGARTVV